MSDGGRGVVVKRLGFVAIPAAAALLSLVPGGGAAARYPGVGGYPGVSFDAHAGSTLVVSGGTYRLALSKRNGKIVALSERAGESPLVRDTNRCLWGVLSASDTSYLGGCSFAPRGASRFSYRWLAGSATLVLEYRSPAFGAATVTLRARSTYFDLRLRIENRGKLRTRVQFPSTLAGDTGTVAAGYVPEVLPGLRLQPGYFSRIANTVQIYPSRWAFADYLALDIGSGHLSFYSISRGPLYPVRLGFLRGDPPAPCSGLSYCIVHEYQTWIRRGTTWTSPVVRVRVGDTAQQSTLAYGHDNGIDAYPSVQSKLGARLDTLARAPLIKANLQLIPPFREWAGELGKLPSPALLHPVGFQVGGHDTNDPDFLPPDPRFGSNADFSAMIAAAHAHGDLVMPYGNVSWWDPTSPTLAQLAPAQIKDVAVIDEHGVPATVAYGPHSGVIVSPYAPLVRRRMSQYMDDWHTTVPADCLFFDQLGARPWLRDFNPASPSPSAYDDGWLVAIAPYRDRCLMVEDGWDRLARDSVGFHGSALMMSRELDLMNSFFGPGNWQPYPIADWLFHDKVLLYQHDLYDGTMAVDDEVLTWNMAFGLVSSYSWDALSPGANPQLDFVGELQRAFGPHYAGIRLSDYRDLAPAVTQSTFGDLTVVANRNGGSAYAAGAFDVAPNGFFAHTQDDTLLGGIFAGRFDGLALSPGTHHLLVERRADGVVVRQPIGADTDLAVALGTAAQSLRATALARDGTAVGIVDGTLDGGRFTFRYSRTLDGRAVSAYRIAPG